MARLRHRLKGWGPTADLKTEWQWNIGRPRRALASSVLSVLLMVGAVLTGSMAGSPAGAATSGSWTALSISPATTFAGISCLTVSTCFAVGVANNGSSRATGVIYSTSNGGGTWAPEPLSVALAGFQAISCVASTSTCVAVGSVGANLSIVERTDNAGGTWAQQTTPTGEFGLSDVSCPSVSACVALVSNSDVGRQVMNTTNSGATWTAEPVPTGTFGLTGVSCPSVNDCVAVGPDSSGHAVVTTTDGGAMWEAVPGAPGLLISVSCVTATAFCVAGGGTTTAPGQIFITSNGGTSWTQGTLPTGVAAITGVSCPTTSDCSSVGSYFDGTSNGGEIWEGESVPADASAGVLEAVTCPSVARCYGVGRGSDGSGLIITSASVLTITTSSLASAAIGSAYSQTLSAQLGNPPYSWRVTSGQLPKGLKLDKTTGVISGIPTNKATSSTFTVEVLDTKTGKPKTQNTATATFTITVS